MPSNMSATVATAHGDLLTLISNRSGRPRRWPTRVTWSVLQAADPG